MFYLDQLRARAQKTGNVACVGLDPVVEKIPISGDLEEKIVRFCTDLINGFLAEGVEPACVKPNSAFYEQYGFEGLRALKKVIEFCKGKGIPVILDAKRGDIGETSAAYARAAFDFWNADAVTVAPYMGSDSVGPFVEHCSKGKGVYVLVRTSNAGAKDIQDLHASGMPLYRMVAQRVVDWSVPGVGAVVGATYLQELEEISRLFVRSEKEIPLLIPGVGTQGGSAADVVAILRKTGNDVALHRINSSRGIIYAYEKEKTQDYVGAAVRALKVLVSETRV